MVKGTEKVNVFFITGRIVTQDELDEALAASDLSMNLRFIPEDLESRFTNLLLEVETELAFNDKFIYLKNHIMSEDELSHCESL